METYQEEVSDMVERLKRRRFWGKLTICFKAGEVYTYVQEETIKPKVKDNGNKE